METSESKLIDRKALHKYAMQFLIAISPQCSFLLLMSKSISRFIRLVVLLAKRKITRQLQPR
jgi:hypothetical protein